MASTDLVSSLTSRSPRAAMFPMLTLSWSCASDDLENAVAGFVRCKTSAVSVDAAICMPLNPWCRPSSRSPSGRAAIRFGVDRG